MKKILVIAAVFISLCSYGQAPRYAFDTTKNQWINAGYKYPSGIFYNLQIGYDTIVNKTIRSIAILPDGFYFKNLTAWERVTSGGAAGISQVVAGYALLNVNDSTLKVDSAVLANYFLRKGDISVVAPVTVVAAPATNPIIGLDATVKVKVATTAALSSYAGIAINVTVTDSLQGGDFVYVSPSLTPDGVLIYAATGIGSGAWVRKYTYGSPLDVRWGGVTGNGTTDDATNLLNVVNAANGLTVPIDIPSGFNIAGSPITISNLNYVHFISKGCTFKALSGTVGAGSTGWFTVTGVNHLFFDGKFIFNGNYPSCNRDFVLHITAPTTSLGTELQIGTISFASLPFSGIRIQTLPAGGGAETNTGYETVHIEQLNGVNCANNRGATLNNDFGYLNVRGAHTNVIVDNVYFRQDAETWGDFNQSPACKMMQFTSDVDTLKPHMKSLHIGDIFVDYGCSPILFLQAVDNVYVEREALYNTLKKPGVVDSVAYTHILTKSWTFNKFDYALPNRSKNRVTIGSFIMTNTTSVVNGQSNLFISLWLDEGIEDVYVEQMDIDAYARFTGANTTTLISGKHIINNLTLRVPIRGNASMTIVQNGGMVNNCKLINTSAIYYVGSGVIRNITQEGASQPTIILEAGSADTTQTRSDATYSGATIGAAQFTNAIMQLSIKYLTATWDSTAKNFGWKFNLNNISGNVELQLVFTVDGVNKTASTYAGQFENQMINYYELRMANCKFKVASTSTGILSRFFLIQPVILVGKDLTKTSSWTMPLKNNQFLTSYLAYTSDNDDTKYPYLTNTRSLAVTGSPAGQTLFDYEYVINNNGANRSQTLISALNIPDKKYRYVKKTNDIYTITLTAASGETINGAASYVMPAYAQSLDIQSDGATNWVITSLNAWGLNFAGTGSPESSITAPIGSIYRRLDGSAGTTIYIKESGTGNTGWVAYTGNTGTVTSVAMTMPGVLFNTSVTGSPITSSGTLAPTLLSQTAYTILGNNTSGSATPTFFAPTLASALFQNQGTTTTLLHGNASGNPSWSAVSLTADITGTLAAGNGGTGITSLGTGVATALGINVGSAGAFITFNGAGGTPSSLTGTNITGTATGLTSGITNALKSATTTIDVSAATAPTSGQVLTATSGTAATWQTVTGTGTVTTVSVVTANGVSGSVANASTTPAITLTLGAITPTTVNGNTFTTGSSTYTGTAAQVYTFPTTTATIARTDAAQTFTGTQTFGGLVSANAGFRMNATDPNGNFTAPNSLVINGQISTAAYLANGAANVQYRVGIGGGTTSTVLTASAAFGGVIFPIDVVTEATSGVAPYLAAVTMNGMTVTNGTGTVTDMTTLLIDAAPTGVTPTNAATAMWVRTGISRFDGSLQLAYVAKTGTYTITNTDHTIDCTSGTFTVTLPTAVGITGLTYIIKNSGAGTITIATTSSQTVDGVTTKTLNTQYTGYQLQSNGANWLITASF